MATVVTVAHQYGSGGEVVAREAARLLDAGYLDREIAHLAAMKAGVSEGALAEYDDKKFQKVEGAFRKIVDCFTRSSPADAYTDYLAVYKPEVDVCVAPALDEKSYIEIIANVMREMASTNNLVVMEHGGNVLLKDVPCVVRVFIEAPLEVRAKRVAESEHLSENEAVRLTRQNDESRAAYNRRLVNTEWGDPNYYDLIVNTGRYPIELAARIVANTAQAWQGHYGTA